MTRLLCMLLVAAFAVPVSAGKATYKCQRDDGSVEYSDKPCPGAEEVELPEITTYESKTTRRQAVESEAAAEEGEADTPPPVTGRSSLTVEVIGVQPDQVFHNLPNDTVQVGVNVRPAMGRDQGIVLYFDGGAVNDEPTKRMSFRVSPVYRGTHTLRARVLDTGGRVVAESEPVTFHVRKHSIADPP